MAFSMALDDRRISADGSERKWLVMTGGTSGIGRAAVERLLVERPEWGIVLLARPSPRIEALRTLPGAYERLAVVDADLASLRSVADACDRVAHRIGAGAIEAIALNAGVQAVSGDAASADGLELTFAVNFLAHFLIAERLKGLLRPGGRVVVTSSEVHDPDAFCLILGLCRAKWQDPTALADPLCSQHHIRSVVNRGEARYCASKLLNLMHVRHLSEEMPGIGVVAFNPSVVPGTEIGRDRNWLLQLGWKYVMPALAPVLPGARTLALSASDLVWLLTEAELGPMSGQYVDGRLPQPGSPESRDRAKIARAIEVARDLLDGCLPSASVSTAALLRRRA